MSKTKGATHKKRANSIEEVTNTVDKIVFGPSAYDRKDGSRPPIFHSELKHKFEEGEWNIDDYVIEKAVPYISLNDMKEELKWCLEKMLARPGDYLLAEIIFMLDKEIVSGENHPIQTACIKLRRNRDGKYQMTLVLNAEFFFGECVTRNQRIGILYHEVYHVLLKHLSLRSPDKQTPLWNIAQDLAINSLVGSYSKSGDGIYSVDLTMFPGISATQVTLDIEDAAKDRTEVYNKVLSEFLSSVLQHQLITGEIASEEEFDISAVEIPTEKIEKEVEKRMKLQRVVGVRSGCFPLVGSFKEVPPNLSSEEYYKILTDKNGPVKAKDLSAMMDLIISEHDWFSDIDPDDLGELPEDASEELKNFYEAVKQKVRDYLNSSHCRGRGSSPLDMLLEKLYAKKPSWSSILSKHMATNRDKLGQTWVRRNRRNIKGIPAIQMDYVHKVRIYIDQSGSMSNEDVAKMYARIKTLLKQSRVEIYHFDDGVDEDSHHFVKNKSDLKPLRTRGGGTDFHSVYEHFKASRKGDVDVVLIMTDMGAPAPQKAEKKVMYLYSEDMNISKDYVNNNFRKFRHKVIELPA
jgi:predicted metal-dependent peptidase